METIRNALAGGDHALRDRVHMTVAQSTIATGALIGFRRRRLGGVDVGIQKALMSPTPLRFVWETRSLL